MNFEPDFPKSCNNDTLVSVCKSELDELLMNQLTELLHPDNIAAINAVFGLVSSNKTVVPKFQPSALSVTFLCIAALEFLLGTSANLTIVIRVVRQGVLKARIRMLLLCLSIANLFSIMIEFPLNQFAWILMSVWPGNDGTCRLFAFLRIFATYLISYVLVTISLDRCLSSIRASSPQDAWHRMTKMLTAAFSGAFVCALPQAGVFGSRDIPGYPGYSQCVSVFLVDKTNGFRVIYPLFCITCFYLAPLIILVLSYSIILYSLAIPIRANDPYELVVYPPTRNVTRSIQHQYILKARRKTLKVLLLTCGTFFALWTPYVASRLFLLSLHDRSDFSSFVSPWLDKSCELLAVSNVVVSPFVYGNFLLKIWRKPCAKLAKFC